MGEIAEQIAQINFFSSDGDSLSDKKIAEIRLLNQISQMESQLKLAHQTNQGLENHLAARIHEKDEAEKQAQKAKELAKSLENKLFSLKKKLRTLEARLKCQKPPSVSTTPGLSEDGDKKSKASNKKAILH